jgi:hypothetical protein
MNKYLAWLPLLMMAGVFTLKPIKEAREEKPLNRSISFAVYKIDSYTSEAYNNTSAQVHIIVENAGKKGRTVVCDTMLNSKMLKDYPSVNKAQFQNIVIPAVNICKEHLQVRYILTYNSKGDELQMQNATVISNDRATQLKIGV